MQSVITGRVYWYSSPGTTYQYNTKYERNPGEKDETFSTNNQIMRKYLSHGV